MATAEDSRGVVADEKALTVSVPSAEKPNERVVEPSPLAMLPAIVEIKQEPPDYPNECYTPPMAGKVIRVPTLQA